MDYTIFDLKVREIISEQLGLSGEEISDEDDIIDTLGATSLDVVELVMALEETFEIKIADSDILENRTVEQVCAYISEKSELK